jgi:hypothetical protein
MEHIEADRVMKGLVAGVRHGRGISFVAMQEPGSRYRDTFPG